MGDVTIAIGTCYRPLSQAGLTEAIERGAANPAWRDTHPGESEGIPHTHHDPVWHQWLMQCRNNLAPPGTSVCFLSVFNRPTWEAYRLLIAEAKHSQCRYLMVIEDDVFIHPKTVRRLYAILEAHPEAGAAGGLYWWRRQPDDPDFPQLYRGGDQGGADGPWLKFPADQVVEAGAAGLGCLMIRMETLRKAEAFGPLFEEEFQVGDIPSHGGDLCLQHRLQQTGAKILVDTGLKAWHRDPYTGVWYPHDLKVRQEYGWPEAPLDGFMRDLRHVGGILKELGIVKPGEEEVGHCSLCRAPMQTAAAFDAHVKQAHPTAINVGINQRGKSGPVPALNLGWGGYAKVHPDFADGTPVFDWTLQDSFAHPGTHVVGDCCAVAKSDASYGLVYANHLIEHLPRAKAAAFLREAWRLVRPGGRLYVACPDGEQVWRAFAARGNDLDAKVYDAPQIAPDGTLSTYPITFRLIIYGRSAFSGDEHRHMYDTADLKRAFAEAGIPEPFVTADTWIPMGLRAIVQKPKAEAAA